MINDLIKDLSYDKITLNQALMRAKLIAFEISNDDFKNWINKELNGYEVGDKLPDYRIISCDIFAVLESYGQRKTVPYDLTDIDKNLNGKLYKMEVQQSVSIIEDGLKNTDEVYGYQDLPVQVVQLLRDMSNNKFIVTVRRRIQLSQSQHILNLTKQKLIDTLLELDKAFPDLQDNFQNTNENIEKTSTIINNHIYGENASSAIGVGDSVNQSFSNVFNQKIERVLSDLKNLGVPDEDIVEVEEIVTKETDKVKLSKRLMSWAGKIATKSIEKGIELQIPLIIEKLQQLL
jgi:hypothetical protein